MRSVNATFAAALAAGTGKPVFRLLVDNGTYATYETKDIVAYKLTATMLTVVLNFWLEHDFTVISIERGLVIGSTEYTYESADFWVRKVVTSNIHTDIGGSPQGLTTITATILPNTPYTIATGNNEYWYFIEDIGVSNNLAYMIQGGTLGSGGDGWKDHKFFPESGNNVTIPDRMQFIPMIRRKYAIAMVARDRDASGNNDNGYLYAFRYKAAETATAYSIKEADFTQDNSKAEAVRFVWRDENNVPHTEGTSGLYINIGYHFSTEMSAPDTNRRPAGTFFVIRPNFAIENGDKVTLNNDSSGITIWANIVESFDPKQSPAWQMRISPIDFLEGLAGGVNPYAPNITTTPSGNDTENSEQSLFEYLIDHTDHETSHGQVLGSHGLRNTIAAGATGQLFPFYSGVPVSGNWNMPLPGTLKNFYIGIASAQPATGTLVATLMVNGSATSVVVTIPAGSAQGTYSDTTNTATIAAGQTIRWNITNNAAAASAQVGAISIFFLPD